MSFKKGYTPWNKGRREARVQKKQRGKYQNHLKEEATPKSSERRCQKSRKERREVRVLKKKGENYLKPRK